MYKWTGAYKKGIEKTIFVIKYLIAEIKTDLIEGLEENEKEFSQKANQKDKKN